MSPDPLLPFGDGHTKLGADERVGLRPAYIATRGELFEAEERNITDALRARAPSVEQLLDDDYLRAFHQRMFAEVWSWAGKYRTRDTNIGIPFEQIPGAVRDLVLDTKEWVESGTYNPDELSLRFHHRLVAAHPFPNGNGRHGRIVADYLVTGLGEGRFSWGALEGDSTEDLRRRYVRALQLADAGEHTELLRFARS